MSADVLVKGQLLHSLGSVLVMCGYCVTNSQADTLADALAGWDSLPLLKTLTISTVFPSYIWKVLSLENFQIS